MSKRTIQDPHVANVRGGVLLWNLPLEHSLKMAPLAELGPCRGRAWGKPKELFTLDPQYKEPDTT
jgi:hypothetical protein